MRLAALAAARAALAVVGAVNLLAGLLFAFALPLVTVAVVDELLALLELLTVLQLVVAPPALAVAVVALGAGVGRLLERSSATLFCGRRRATPAAVVLELGASLADTDRALTAGRATVGLVRTVAVVVVAVVVVVVATLAPALTATLLPPFSAGLERTERKTLGSLWSSAESGARI